MSALTTPRTRRPKAAAEPAEDARPSPVDTGFAEAAPQVMLNLQAALAALLKAAPDEITKAIHVERVLKIDHLTGWQVYQVATAENPLAVAGHVPVKAGVQRLLKAAAQRRIPAPAVARVSAAFEDFEQLIARHAGDRSTLSAMLAPFLPEEREKAELASKKTAFKGMSELTGVAAEMALSARFLRVGSDPRLIDQTVLSGSLGTRRVRPDSRIVFANAVSTSTNVTRLDLDGNPLVPERLPILPEFCSSPLPAFDVRRAPESAFHYVAGNQVGLNSAFDLVTARQFSGIFPRYRPPEGAPSAGMWNIVDTAIKRMLIDVFIHKDVYPDNERMLTIHDTAMAGFVRSSKELALREHDRLPLHESIRTLGWGFDHAAIPQVPRYLEMLRHVCARQNLNPADYRGYRLDVAYPMYSAQYTMWFKLPEAPTGG